MIAPAMKPVTVRIGPKHPHALVAKFINCLVEAKGDFIIAEKLAEAKAPALPVLPKIFERASVGAMPLGSSDPFNFGNEVYLALLDDELRALLGRFVRVPPRVKIPLENAAGGNAAWLGQGLPGGILKSTSALGTLDVFKMVAPSVLSRELFRFGVQQENFFMRLLRADVSRFFASALFDSSKALTTANPASLTNGAHGPASTGSTAAQIVADLNTLISWINTAMVDPAWVMRPKTFHRIAATLGGVGLPVSKDNLLGIPVTTLSGMPQEIVLLDCASVFNASDEQANLSVSTEASVEMSDSPSSSGISGTGASLVSFWQAGMVGVSATLMASWLTPFQFNVSPQMNSGVAYMTVAY